MRPGGRSIRFCDPNFTFEHAGRRGYGSRPHQHSHVFSIPPGNGETGSCSDVSAVDCPLRNRFGAPGPGYHGHTAVLIERRRLNRGVCAGLNRGRMGFIMGSDCEFVPRVVSPPPGHPATYQSDKRSRTVLLSPNSRYTSCLLSFFRSFPGGYVKSPQLCL